MGRQIISDQRQDHHDHVLGHADTVAIGHFGHRNASAHRRLKIDMIGADPGRDRKLQSSRFGDPILGQVGRPERLRNHDDYLTHRHRAAIGQLMFSTNLPN